MNEKVDRSIRIWLRGAIERWWFLCDKHLMERGTRSESWWSTNLWDSVIDPVLQNIDGAEFERHVQSSLIGVVASPKGWVRSFCTLLFSGGAEEGQSVITLCQSCSYYQRRYCNTDSLI